MARILKNPPRVRANFPWEMFVSDFLENHQALSWVWSLILMVAITSLVAITMLRSRRPASKRGRTSKGKEPMGSSRGGGGGNGNGDDDDDDDDDDDEDDPAYMPPLSKDQDDWRKNLHRRAGNCERQVKFTFENAALTALNHRGLKRHCEKQIKGYCKEACAEFYGYMVMSATPYDTEGAMQFTTKVFGKKIKVTPDSIAKAMPYTRPGIAYSPFDERPKIPAHDIGDLCNVMVESAIGFDGTTKQFRQGGLRSDYQFLNKILHHNIHPKASEKFFNNTAASFLESTMKGDYPIDYARWIYFEMIDFTREMPKHGNMPYPALVTELVRKEFGTRGINMSLTSAERGPITQSTLNRIIATTKSVRGAGEEGGGHGEDEDEPARASTHSEQPRTSTSRPGPSSSQGPRQQQYPRDFEPQGKTWQEKMSGWMKAIFCQISDVRDQQKRIRSRQKEISRRQSSIEEQGRRSFDRAEHFTRWAESQGAPHYESPVREPMPTYSDDSEQAGDPYGYGAYEPPHFDEPPWQD